MSDTLTLPGQQIRQIAAGKKTQHRHPARHSRDFHTPLPCPYRIGQLVAVRGAGDKDDIGPRLHIEITGHNLARLDEVTLHDVIAEGHRTTPAFMRDWLARHDRSYLPEFEDSTVEHRYRTRHLHRDVWVLAFTVAEEHRYLAARPDSVGDAYTLDVRKAVRGEPEAVDAVTLARLTTEARATAALVRSDEYIATRQRLAAELERLEMMDDKRVSDRVRLMRRNLQAIDRIIKQEAA